MNVNLPVKSNKENKTLTKNLIFTKVKLWQISINTYNIAISLKKILNYKPVYTFPD